MQVSEGREAGFSRLVTGSQRRMSHDAHPTAACVCGVAALSLGWRGSPWEAGAGEF